VSVELVTGAPHPDLAGAVVRYTGYAERAPEPVRFRELPCTHVPVIIDLDAGWTIADCRHPDRPPERLSSFVAGLTDGPVIVTHGGSARCLQVDLAPLAARRLLGVPMSELANRSVALEDVLGRRAGELAERVGEAPSWAEGYALVEGALRARLAEAPPADPGVAWSLGHLVGSGGGAPIRGLASELGWSHRRLIARFRDAVGMPPKRVARILRFERLTALIRADPALDWARAAAECGFADQAHLVREVRDLAGVTPTQLRADVIPSKTARWSRPSLAPDVPHERGAAMTETTTLQGAYPIVPYARPREAIAWLERAFGAVAIAVYPPEPDQPLVHAEVRVGSGLVMINDAERSDDSPFALPGPVLVYVVVDDPDALHDRAAAAGAEIVMGLTDQDYGSRDFAARDPYGNVWSFGTYRPSVSG
jgi:uncharacterized glyoxalase superfamily protein PhnB/AraC-like DNA-binding protein